MYSLIYRRVERYFKANLSDLSEHFPATVSDASYVNDPSQYSQLTPVLNPQIFAGTIPKHGYVLRLIQSGSNHGVGCPRCPWNQRCNGCAIPDRPDFVFKIRHGESIAVDWHMAVFQELLDLNASAEIIDHESVRNKSTMVSMG